VARRLGEQEKALWGRVIATVTPMHVVKPKVEVVSKPPPKPLKPVRVERSRDTPKAGTTDGPLVFARGERKLIPKPDNLDGQWDRRIDKGAIVPDVSVDLHGSGLSGAYARLDGALEQAIAQRMKVVLLVTGKVRTHDRASGEGRGAIASVVRDWLAASRHAGSIAAVRNAHPRHGGAGALYIVLKR
jgi:DNA-nicking Smr family endonuclease